MVQIIVPKAITAGDHVRRSDLLAKLVLFLSTTESRSKVYRVVQYSAKMAKWTLLTAYGIDRTLVQSQPSHTSDSNHHSSSGTTAQDPCIAKLNGSSTSHRTAPVNATTSPHTSTPHSKWRHAALAALSRIELLFSDARKVFRLLQFLEMIDLLRTVDEPEQLVRVLRRLRIVCFLLFYLLENAMLLLLRVSSIAPRDPRMRLLKRSLNGFWCLSILFAFPLDHLMGRHSALATLKKLLDLPVAFVAYREQRVSDGLFGALGIASGSIGIYLRWQEVVRKTLLQ